MKNVEKIKPTGLFTNYIYKAIPLAFDESMSYYETLCGLLSYLKDTVIPALNNNADAIIEVQSLITQLQDYVDNYFNNLDVQQEINNKLDEMVASGTLQEIIANYLNSKAIFGYDNVESMKQATNLINGSYAKTLGFYNKNDGGNALYKIRQITNEDVVDEMNIIALNDSMLIAELIINEPLNIKKIGASPTIDDNTPYINKALELTNNIYIPSGNFKYKNSITITDNYIIKCDGTLNMTETKSGIIIDGINNNIFIKKLISKGNGIEVVDNNKLTYGNEINIDNIIASYYGIYIHSLNPNNGIQYNNFIGNEINGNNGGIYLSLDQTGHHNNENRFINFHVASNNGDGITIIDKKSSGNNSECSGHRFLFNGLENCNNAIVLNQTRWNNFISCRSQESIRQNHLVLEKMCTSNTIGKDSTPLNKIDKSKMSNGYNNIINGVIFNNDTNYETITNKLIINTTNFEYIPSRNRYINTFPLDGLEFTFDDEVYTYIASKDNATIKLGKCYCNPTMIGYSFIVNTGNPSKLVDINNKVIIDTTDTQLQGYKNVEITLAGINPNNNNYYWTKNLLS